MSSSSTEDQVKIYVLDQRPSKNKYVHKICPSSSRPGASKNKCVHLLFVFGQAKINVHMTGRQAKINVYMILSSSS